MSPFLAVDSGTDSIAGQFVEHILMLSTWAACGRAGEPFPDHHLSLDPAPPGNLCSTQDPEIDAHQPRGRLQSLFLLAPHIAQCTAYIRLHISDPKQFLSRNLFCRLQIYKQPNYQLKQPNFWLQPRQQLGQKKKPQLLRLPPPRSPPPPRLKLLSQHRPNLNQPWPFHASIAAAEDSIRFASHFEII